MHDSTIARGRRYARGGLFIWHLIGGCAIALGSQDSDLRPALRGTVTDGTRNPVPGTTVYIYTAAVRRGFSPY